ncbi:hypothetical protein [Streptomyces sp. NPDC021020]|uniref:hypothetical protein n=1 Tax=Streptomyces sp. NPDC021020 TaxID=3365109 RepID=UPI0037AD869F
MTVELPAAPRPFVDRDEERARAERAAREGAGSGRAVALSLSGPPGVGKSALAYRIGRALHDSGGYTHVLTVDLDDYRGPDGWLDTGDVLTQLLESLDVEPQSVKAAFAARRRQYRAVTARNRVVLVLDNARYGSEVADLLPASDGVLITTGHRPLHDLDGGAGLDLPVGPLDDASARQLLEGIVTDGRLAAEPEAVDALVRLCEGSPSALRIAACTLRRHGLRPLTRLLGEVRGVLDEEVAPVVDRVLDVGYGELSASAGELYRLLPFHPGPSFTRASAAALLGRGADACDSALEELHAQGLADVRDAFRDPAARLRLSYARRAHARRTADSAPTATGPHDRAAALRRFLRWETRQWQQADLLLAGPRLRVHPLLPEEPGAPDVLLATRAPGEGPGAARVPGGDAGAAPAAGVDAPGAGAGDAPGAGAGVAPGAGAGVSPGAEAGAAPSAGAGVPPGAARVSVGDAAAPGAGAGVALDPGAGASPGAGPVPGVAAEPGSGDVPASGGRAGRVPSPSRWMYEDRHVLFAAVRLAHAVGEDALCVALCEAAWTYAQDHPPKADLLDVFRLGRDSALRAGDLPGAIRMRCQLARWLWPSDPDAAEPEMAAALAAAELLPGDDDSVKLRASALEFRGMLDARKGDLASAAGRYAESRTLQDSIGNDYGVLLQDYRLGQTLAELGEVAAAEALLTRAHAAAEADGRDRITARTGFALAHLLAGRGALDEARVLYGASLDGAHRRGSDFDRARVLDALAALEERAGRPAEAAAHRTASAAVRERNGLE